MALWPKAYAWCVHFGHLHIGLTLGGLSASLVADIVGERPSTLHLDAFAAQRF